MANTKKNQVVKPDPIVSDNDIAAKSIKPREIDPHQYVTVRNGFQGRLVYKSSRTGELFVWDEFGAEQEMELRELKDAKNAHKKMFINNWFMFDEGWVVDYLGLNQYYKNAVSIDDFDSIFSKTPAEIKKIISNMSDGQKRSVAYRAHQLIQDNAIDSLKSIAALEDALGVELIEK